MKEKWPIGQRNSTLFIQQDNAKPHCKADDVVLNQACSSGGWDILLTNQPSNTPHLYVLD